MNISPTSILKCYKSFSREFWLGYKTLEKLHPNFDSIKMALLRTKRVDPSYYKDLPTYEVERELLREEWRAKAEEAKQLGTSTHEYIRNLFCTDLKAVREEFRIPTDLYSIMQYEQFLNCSSGIFIEQRLEFPLEFYTLVGIPDCFIIHDGVVDIVDYKTSEEPIKFKSMYEVSQRQTKKFKYPLSKYDMCNGIEYQFQLSIYMWLILKLRPDLKPGQLQIMWIKEKKIKQIFPVEYLEKPVEKLLIWHQNNLHLQEEMNKCNEIEY